MTTIPIAQAIKAIRQEITTAVKQGADEAVKFDLGDIELEFQVEISQGHSGSGGGSAGFNVGVVAVELSGEGGVERSKTTTHTVKLTLKPVTSQGGKVQVSAQDVQTRPD
ncbi:MAG: trypco2 family protein [Prochlorotrichaceae cyanobacterium]